MLLLQAKAFVVSYLARKLQPLIERVRSRLTSPASPPNAHALFEAFVPRIPQLIEGGLNDRSLELQKAKKNALTVPVTSEIPTPNKKAKVS